MANEAPNDDRLKKIFVGGLNRSTSNDGLKAYFESYGEMSDCVVITDSNTKESRGFGYVTFVDKESVIAVLQDKNEKGPHNIDGKDVEVKRAIPKDDDSQTARLKTKKLFIGGLKDEATAEDIKQSLTEAVRGIAPNSVDLIMKRADDTSSGPSKHRGFCFVEYEDEDLVDELCCIKKVNICGKFVELKKAEPKDKDSRGQGGRGGRGGGRGGFRGGRGGGRDQGGHGGYGGYPGGGYNPYGGYGGDGGYGGYDNNGYDYYGMGAYQQSASGYGAQGGWGSGGNQRYRPY